MHGQELRRFITTFLVLALLAGSGSLAFTSLVRGRSEGPAAKLTEQTATSQAPKVGEKAFVEDIASTRIEGYDLAAEFSPVVGSDDNFTDTLAKSLAYNFVKANPEGPDLTAGTGITPPGDLQAIMDEYVMSAALSPTTYAIDATRLKVARAYTPEQAEKYFETLTSVFEGSGADMRTLTVRMGETPDTPSIQASSFLIAQAQERLYDQVVPEPAADIHRAALSYLELNRKLADLDYTTDPLKAAVFAAKFPELQAREEAKLKLALDTLEAKGPAAFEGATRPLTLASMLGIRTANAIFVHDPVHTVKTIFNGIADYGTWGQLILQQAKSIALQILKNQLVGRMIQQTVKWVQGGGKPQFITNWKAFLKDSATGAVNQFINAVEPRLCQNVRAFTTDFLKNNVPNTISGARDPYQQFNCTLDQLVQSVKDFYDDFQNGGWVSLAQVVLQPQNNTWGAVVLTHESVIAQAAQARAADEADAQANKGFKGLSRCVKTQTITVDSKDLPQARKDPNFEKLLSCSNVGGDSSYQYANCERNPDQEGCDDILAQGRPGTSCQVVMCAPDGKEKTTPGGFVADQLSDVVGNGPINNIVNASDLTGLVTVLVDAAITRLINGATSGILGLFTGNGNGGSGTTGTGGGSGPGTGTGTGTDTNEDEGLDAIKAQASQLIAAHRTRVRDAANDNGAWTGAASSTQSLLISVIPTCPAFADDAQQRLEAIGRIAPKVALDRDGISSAASRLASTSDAIANATSAIAVSDLISSLDAISSDIATLATRATTRTGQLQALQSDAQENLTNRACRTPLSTLDE